MLSLRRLHERLMYVIGRGRIRILDDSGAFQSAQLDFGPTGGQGPGPALKSVTPMVGLFGLASSPPLGSDVIAVFVGGNRSTGVGIGHNHQTYRLRGLSEGDAALYDMRGAYLWMTAAGPVLDAAGQNVTIQNAANINITGSGTVTVTAPHVIVDSNDVELGGTGGHAVARVGDAVAGGVITGGSSKVKAT